MLAATKWIFAYGLVFIISIPINGLLISMTWGWFVVPITSAREITVTQGIGLSIFLSIIGRVATGHLEKLDFANDTDLRLIAAKGLSAGIAGGIAGPLLALAVAWAWHTFFQSPPM